MFCFGAALAQAQRLNCIDEDGVPERPVVAKLAQLIDGRMDLVAVQLNNLRLGQSDGVKNLVWLEKAQPLYNTVQFDTNMEKVEALNVETFKKFANLVLH